MSAKLTPSDDIFQQLDKACPTTNAEASDIITIVIDEQHQIGKCFTLKPDNYVEKTSTVAIARGIACQYHVPDFATLEAVLRIASDNTHAAIINAGWTHVAIGERFILLSKRILTERGLDAEAVTTEKGMKAFARLKVHAKPSTWQLLDRDEDKFTPAWAIGQSFGAWLQNLDKILPGIATVKMLRAHSSSARVLRDDGTPVGGGNGHVWIKIKDAADAERTRTAIIARAYEHDLAWTKPRFSKSTGLECGRGTATIVDASVWNTGRLVFGGRPTYSAGLTIIPQQFELIDGENEVLDTSCAVISPLKTFRESTRHGAPLRISRQRAGFTLLTYNLRLDTELELEDGTVTTVRDLMLNFTGKVRCQAPFRASNSLAAFFALDDNGNPFVFDSGTDTRHVLEETVLSRNVYKDCEALIREVKRRLGRLIGEDNIEAVFNDVVLRSAWNSTFCQSTNNKLVVLNKKYDLVELSEKDFTTFGLRRTFGCVYHDDTLEEVIAEMALAEPAEKELRKSLAWLAHGPLIERLKLLKQAKSLNISVDMFVKRGHMTVSDGVATIVLPHHRFTAKTMIEPHVVDQVVRDYRMHFPEFDALLNLVLYARFATDRRHAFVWLHSPSSWGKGFLLAIFSLLGLVVEISAAEIEKAIAGAPVGLSLTDTLRSWILFVDEFKAASSELKLLNSTISLSPKNQLRCRVQLYTKLFSSAENVRSLVGEGVEAQFNNRFAYLSPSTHDQKLEDRSLFKESGKATYVGALVSYVAEYLNAGTDRLRAMGYTESSKTADNFIEAYQSERRLNMTFGNLDDSVDDLVGEIRHCLSEYARWVDEEDGLGIPPDAVQGIGMRLQQTLKRTACIGYVSQGEGSKQRRKGIVLAGAVQFIKSYLALSDDRSTVGKMQYKADIIAAKLHMRPEPFGGKVRVYDADGKTGHGVLRANKRGVVVFIEEAPVVD